MTGIQIAWEDVFSALNMIKVPLIVIAIGLIAWIAFMVFAKKMPKTKRRFARWQSVIAFVLFLGIMVNTICFGTMHNTIEMALGDTGHITEETAENSRKVVQEVSQEFPIVKDTTPNMMNPRLYTTSYNKPQGQQFDDTAVLSFIKLQYT